MADIWIFVGALGVAYLVPGPDLVLLLETGTRRGRTYALMTATGFAMARGAHVALAAFGLAGVLRNAPWAFDVVRLAGAAYLIWLGIRIMRVSWLSPREQPHIEYSRQPSYRGCFFRGLLTNISNPKALLFCSVLLPQFIQPDHGAVYGQFLLLGVILVGVGLAFDIIYACIGEALGQWTSLYSIIQVLQRWGFASLLIGFGVRLAFAQRP